MKALVISAAQSGAGKSMITLGLLRALRDRGIDVVGAKSGPDYIDPGFHGAASGKSSVNLDAWAMSADRLRAIAGARTGALLLVEGAMGLFDGAPTGRGATADVADALNAPVVLVLDVAAQAQTAAAVANGLARWRADLRIAGVILNRVGSARHEAMLRQSLEPTGLAVLGAVPRDGALATPSRHLGLVLAAERPDLDAFVVGAARLIARHVDLDALVAAARPLTPPMSPTTRLEPLGQRLAIARDDAFSFLYPHLLEDWRALGAEIAFFSPLADQEPSTDADTILLPGGYPELHAGRLAAAERFKAGLRMAQARGRLIFGECGGYMVMGDGLIDAEGRRHEMVGLLRVETSFAERRLTLGYRRLTPLVDALWATPVSGHEFHYSVATEEEGEPVFEAATADFSAIQSIGRRNGSAMGSYAHVIDTLTSS